MLLFFIITRIIIKLNKLIVKSINTTYGCPNAWQVFTFKTIVNNIYFVYNSWFVYFKTMLFIYNQTKTISNTSKNKNNGK